MDAVDRYFMELRQECIRQEVDRRSIEIVQATDDHVDYCPCHGVPIEYCETAMQQPHF